MWTKAETVHDNGSQPRPADKMKSQPRKNSLQSSSSVFFYFWLPLCKFMKRMWKLYTYIYIYTYIYNLNSLSLYAETNASVLNI